MKHKHTRAGWAVYLQTARGWQRMTKGYSFQGACRLYDFLRGRAEQAVFCINYQPGSWSIKA